MCAEHRDELNLSSTAHPAVLLAEELFLPSLPASSPVNNSSDIAAVDYESVAGSVPVS